jgi:hypothetical protein
MAKLQVIYEVSDDIPEIIKKVEDHINLNTDDEVEIFEFLQLKCQIAFDEGRRFQKHLNGQSEYRDSLLYNADIK